MLRSLKPMYVENVEMQLKRLPSHSVSLLDTINIASIRVNNTNSAVYTRDRKKSSLLVAKIYSGQYLKTHPIARRQQGLPSETKKSVESRRRRTTTANKLSFFEKIQHTIRLTCASHYKTS